MQGRPGRLCGLDATRGLAMLLVCLSHFGDACLTTAAPRLDAELRRLTLAATPSFVLTSGVLLGFLYRSHATSFDRIRRRLVDRALFLLTVARLLILAAHVPFQGIDAALGTIFITDVIAGCVIVGCVVVPTVRGRVRLPAALALYAAASALALGWHTVPGSMLQLFKHVMVGHGPGEELLLAYGFPLLQWLAVYLAASVVGEQLARPTVLSRHTVVLPMATVGISCIAAGIGMRLVLGAPPHNVAPGYGPPLAEFLRSIGQKLPPGPVYLLLYCGAGLLLIAGCLGLERMPRASRLLTVPALVGRHSLFVFVGQYFIYYVVLHALPIASGPAWAPVFAASLVLLAVAAYAWQRAGGQRLLTVGYTGLIEWAEQKATTRGPRFVLRSVA